MVMREGLLKFYNQNHFLLTHTTFSPVQSGKRITRSQWCAKRDLNQIFSSRGVLEVIWLPERGNSSSCGNPTLPAPSNAHTHTWNTQTNRGERAVLEIKIKGQYVEFIRGEHLMLFSRFMGPLSCFDWRRCKGPEAKANDTLGGPSNRLQH